MKNYKQAVGISLLLLMLTWSCQKPPRSIDKSLRWFQQSAECRALFLQTYAQASAQLKTVLINPGDKPPAIVIDIDETVLDNSPQQAGLETGSHSDARLSWDEWCLAAQAEPLPGALDFLNEADRLGIGIFYVSNRDHKHLQSTLTNLKKWGFPQSTAKNVLLRESDSSKEARRQTIAVDFQIVMFLGDNLGDLSIDFETPSASDRALQVDHHKGDFGTRFFVFPNPLYGSWQKLSADVPLKTWPDRNKKRQTNQ